MSKKTEVVSFKTTPAIKQALETIGGREHRSNANVLERLILDYCNLHGILVDGEPDQPTTHKSNKKGMR
jgi:hypothetical protein